MKEIRLLRADEIECRVGTDKNNKVMLLLYKDARVDMNMLDELFGIDGWQRTHDVVNGNLFCTVSIWSEEKQQWIKKQDVGVESNTEKEKGEASDSFKRACFNIGIGRELYTSPVIKFSTDASEYWTPANGKPMLTSKFTVKEIGYNEHREINALTIVDQKGKERYKLGHIEPEPINEPKTEKKEIDDNMRLALAEVKESKTLKELTDVWNRWKGLQVETEFSIACTARRVAIQTPLR